MCVLVYVEVEVVGAVVVVIVAVVRFSSCIQSHQAVFQCDCAIAHANKCVQSGKDAVHT